MKKIVIIFSRFLLLIVLLIILLFYAANPLVLRYDNQVRKYIQQKTSLNLSYQNIRLRGFPLPSVVVNGLSYQQGYHFSINVPKIIIYINPLYLFWNNSSSIWALKAIQPKIDLISKEAKPFVYDLDSYNFDTIQSVLSYEPRYEELDFILPINLQKFFKNNFKLSNIDVFNASISIWNENAELKKINDINFHTKLELADSILLLDKTHFSAYCINEGNLKYYFGGRNSLTFNLVNQRYLEGVYKGSFYTKSEDKKIFQVFSPTNISASFDIIDDKIKPILINLDSSLKGNINSEKISISALPFLSKARMAAQLESEIVENGKFNITSVVELRKDFRLWNTNISGADYSANIASLEKTNENLLQLKEARVLKDKSNILISGSTNLDFSEYMFSVVSENFELNNFDSIYDLPDLSMSGEFQIYHAKKNLDKIESKNLQFKDYISSNKKVLIDSGVVRNLFLLIRNKKIKSLSADLFLQDLKVNYPKLDLYKASEVSGNIKIDKGKNYEFINNLSFKNFSYDDPDIKLKDVNVRLDNFIGKYSERNGFSASSNLTANKLNLKANNIEINNLISLSGLVNLTIDSAGKFLIKSDASASDVRMNLAGKEVIAGGMVDFTLTDSNKSFLAKSITGTLNTKNFSLADANYEMTETSHTIKKSLLNIFDGTIRFSGNLSRVNNNYNLDLDSEDVSLSEFAYLLPEDRRGSFSGKMDMLKLTLSGQQGDLNTITGQAELLFQKGILKKLELDEILGTPVQGSISNEGTYVENLELKATIDKGEVNSENFVLAGRFYTLKGRGNYSYATGFNVKGNAVYLEKTLSELGGPIKILRKLIGSLIKVQIPVKIKGPAADPVVEADLKRVMSVISPGRAVQSLGKGVGDIYGEIKDVVTGN